jgi:ubiquinone biosynthesis protein COQ9
MTSESVTSESVSDPTGTTTGEDASDLALVVDGALRLAGITGWTGGTLAQVAEDLGMPLARVLSLTPTRTAVLSAWGKQVDARVLEDGVEIDLEETVRDRLFDLIMRRLDALDPHKDAVATLPRACAGDPLLALTASMDLSRSMAMTLEAAGVSASGFAGLLRVKGLSALFLHILRIWLADDSPDMTKTMAALDKALDRAESAANSLFSGRGGEKGDSKSQDTAPDA